MDECVGDAMPTLQVMVNYIERLVEWIGEGPATLTSTTLKTMVRIGSVLVQIGATLSHTALLRLAEAQLALSRTTHIQGEERLKAARLAQTAAARASDAGVEDVKFRARVAWILGSIAFYDETMSSVLSLP